MNLRSPWAAAGVVLVTLLVCYFGVRVELAQAHRSAAQHAGRVDGPITAAARTRH